MLYVQAKFWVKIKDSLIVGIVFSLVGHEEPCLMVKTTEQFISLVK